MGEAFSEEGIKQLKQPNRNEPKRAINPGTEIKKNKSEKSKEENIEEIFKEWKWALTEKDSSFKCSTAAESFEKPGLFGFAISRRVSQAGAGIREKLREGTDTKKIAEEIKPILEKALSNSKISESGEDYSKLLVLSNNAEWLVERVKEELSPDFSKKIEKLKEKTKKAAEIIENIDKPENQKILAEALQKLDLTLYHNAHKIDELDLRSSRSSPETLQRTKELYGVDALVPGIIIPSKNWWGGFAEKLGLSISMGGISLHPGDLSEPFDKVSIRIIREDLSNNLHEDLHGAYFLYRYLKRGLTAGLLLEEGIIDEIFAGRDDIRIGRDTWKGIAETFEEYYLPYYKKQGAVKESEIPSILAKTKETINTVEKLQKAGVSEKEISMLLINSDTLNEVVMAGENIFGHIKTGTQKIRNIKKRNS